jgi:hypothetical protein
MLCTFISRLLLASFVRGGGDRTMRAVMHSSNSVNDSRRIQGLVTTARSSGVLTSAWVQSTATSSKLPVLVLLPKSPPPARAGPRAGQPGTFHTCTVESTEAGASQLGQENNLCVLPVAAAIIIHNHSHGICHIGCNAQVAQHK